VSSLQENRAPLLALAVWVGVYVLDVAISPFVDGAMLAYQLGILMFVLVILPIHLTTRWNVGEAAIFLGFGLVFWGLGEFICGFSGVGTGGMCFLLRHWYPSSFTILMRIFSGCILIIYLVLNPEVGAGKAVLPVLSREEGIWFIKIALVVGALMAAGWVAYQAVARSAFGGEVLYILTAEYGNLEQPELVYEGLLGRSEDGLSEYVLVREELNMTNLAIGRIGGVTWDSEILDRYLGSPVEILGKLSQFVPEEPRLLFPGRIREVG
jgi:hypothetical protein